MEKGRQTGKQSDGQTGITQVNRPRCQDRKTDGYVLNTETLSDS